MIPQRTSSSDVFSVLSYQHKTMFGENDVYNSSLGHNPF
ncbi:hypothetical protein Pf1_01096 [Flavobacterium columnare]|nr:hypothetical protein Pf1_01096 [Flavobacterium columnare]